MHPFLSSWALSSCQFPSLEQKSHRRSQASQELATWLVAVLEGALVLGHRGPEVVWHAIVLSLIFHVYGGDLIAWFDDLDYSSGFDALKDLSLRKCLGLIWWVVICLMQPPLQAMLSLFSRYR